MIMTSFAAEDPSENLSVVGRGVQIQMKAFFLTQGGLAPAWPTTNTDSMRTVLESRFQCSTQSVFTWPAESMVNAGRDQVRKTICSRFEKWTKSLRVSDTAVVCFSVSLLTDEKNQIVVPTGMFDGKDFESDTIPLSWFVDNLNRSKVKVRLVLLDSFFESDAKDKSIATADPEQAAKLFASSGQTAILAAFSAIAANRYFRQIGIEIVPRLRYNITMVCQKSRRSAWLHCFVPQSMTVF